MAQNIVTKNDPMARNIEIKAEIHAPEQFKSRTERLATSGPSILNQCDTFFNVSEGRLKWREVNTTCELIYYMRPDTTRPSLSSYSVEDVTHMPGLKDLLENALGIQGIVKKTRTLFMIDQTRVHLDEVEGLGSFMELEVVLSEDQPEQDGHAIVLGLMNALGVDPSDLLKEAYIDLIMDQEG